MKKNTQIHYNFYDSIDFESKIYEFFPKIILKNSDVTINYVNKIRSKFKYIEFISKNFRWIGKFECGEGNFSFEPFALNNSAIILVVNGQAYWIDFYKPYNFIAIKSYTINQVFISCDNMKSYLVSYTEISCCDESGQIWTSDRLSYDGIKLVSYDSDVMIGKAWDASEGKDVEFRLHLNDGTHTGGAFFGYATSS
jgi:hypothetical protein